jgi:heat shock protein HslJ
MTDDTEDGTAGQVQSDPAPGSGQPEKRDPMVWVAIALLGCLILLVVFVNVPGIRASAGTTMAQTDWQLQSYADATGVLVPALTDPVVTIRFGQDGSVTGFSGCNRYAATYTTKDYSINISSAAQSAAYCPEPGVMAQESAYLADLDATTEFRLTESNLKMFARTGKPLLVFAART